MKRTHAAGNHHGAGMEPRAGGCRHVEFAGFQRAQLGDFLAQMNGGMEWLHLLQQSIDQFPRCPFAGLRN